MAVEVHPDHLRKSTDRRPSLGFSVPIEAAADVPLGGVGQADRLRLNLPVEPAEPYGVPPAGNLTEQRARRHGENRNQSGRRRPPRGPIAASMLSGPEPCATTISSPPMMAMFFRKLIICSC